MKSRVKTLSGAKPCVFAGMVASGVAKVRSLFPRGAGLDQGKLLTKSARDHIESSVCTSNCQNVFKKTALFGALLEDEAGRIRTR